MQKLIEKVKQWSKDRGITINGKSLTQTLKLISEFGEIYEAKFENDRKKLIDAVGDNLVVVINLLELIKKESGKDYELDWNKDIKVEFDLGPYYYGELADNIAKQNFDKSINDLEVIISFLRDIANKNNFTLKEALEFAYNEIKDRKGFLNENGSFIKSTDPNYEKLYKEFLRKQKWVYLGL